MTANATPPSTAVRLGPFVLANPWILAPMAGVSEKPFRNIAREMGAAATPTELVSARGLSHGAKKTLAFLDHDPGEKPFWVQIFGGDPEDMAAGALRAKELGADLIDVNMGCPVKKVTKTGSGSNLLRDPARAAAIVEAIAARTGLPVTAKIRTGWDDSSVNAVEMTRVLAEAGCVAVAVHGRTRAQAYSGLADWSVITQVARAASIPVIGNGDIRSAEDGHRRMRDSGCAAVMIGRGAMGNPWLFAELLQGKGARPTAGARWQVVHRHLIEHVARFTSELAGVRSFRMSLSWYARGLVGAAAFRRVAVRIDTLAELVPFCERFFCAAVPAPGPAEELELDVSGALG